MGNPLNDLRNKQNIKERCNYCTESIKVALHHNTVGEPGEDH